ncbi:ATP-binding protein [Actinomadura sp. WMMB 499]|uniref:ATP-binding protein n=1 Tax=Actinomadura sp. WMMB 499 TaxID=1219491 RepID=UPI001C3F7E04|nr:ATP-binding protein [Actinomadura sp. WMMB 499]
MTRKHLGTCVIPSAPQNVSNGRRWLLGRLEPLLGPGHTACDDSVLLLSEALTNAVVHGGGDIVEVDAYVSDGAVRIEITDGGADTVPHYLDDPGGVHGRGLPIMRMLTRTWGFEQLDDGRLRFWFEVSHGDGRRPSQARYDGGRDEPPTPVVARTPPRPGSPTAASPRPPPPTPPTPPTTDHTFPATRWSATCEFLRPPPWEW